MFVIYAFAIVVAAAEKKPLGRFAVYQNFGQCPYEFFAYFG